ncbi:hypothetical protein ON021_00580 [Microcoleus sp. HI-ES]|nr:hypothetical protein [Microcoleus sp. HI-ES]
MNESSLRFAPQSAMHFRIVADNYHSLFDSSKFRRLGAIAIFASLGHRSHLQTR